MCTEECIGIVFCIRDYISRIRIRSILMEFLKLRIVLMSPEGRKYLQHQDEEAL